MAISANYPTPVFVNGYACNNCAQVAEAKQDINPADPKAGPWGVDAGHGQQPAFTLGGALANSAASAAAAGQPVTGAAQANPPTGAVLNISA